jgi:hypothetical protein
MPPSGALSYMPVHPPQPTPRGEESFAQALVAATNRALGKKRYTKPSEPEGDPNLCRETRPSDPVPAQTLNLGTS